MPLTDVEFIQIHRKKQRFCRKTHKCVPFFTLCIRKKTLESLKGKHLLLVGLNIGSVALKECKMQVREDAAATDQSYVKHWGITELSESEDENQNRKRPRGVLGVLTKQESVAKEGNSKNTS